MKEKKGLTAKEVKERIHEGKVNNAKVTSGKSYFGIVASNLFTFFNFINVVLFLMVVFSNSIRNGLFIFVILANIIIGTYQEIKAKKMLNRLSILKNQKVMVYRENKQQEINMTDLVLDDWIILTAGNQIPTDAKVMNGRIEVNEALLTGEAEVVEKETRDKLYSGSFVTAGKAICQVIHVGADNYIHQMTQEAKRIKYQSSLLRESLNKIVKVVGILLVPICSLLFFHLYYWKGLPFEEASLQTVAAAIGMFPEGLVLLTSITLTLSVIYLAKKQVLVQELHCIDALARTDVLCLDKTGTITQGSMQVERTILLEEIPFDEIMGNLMANLEDDNATAKALREKFPGIKTYNALSFQPFSSDRKYSSVCFLDKGTYYLGAAQFLLENFSTEEYAKEGLRVLVLAHSETNKEEKKALALILLSDKIREDAKETLAYFKKQNVVCKIISGDDPITVSAIAQKVEMDEAEKYIDATTLTTTEEIKEAVRTYHIFGRVTPQQKKEMVVCLKELGHTVAMTGDGVNDILAFKEADCSIAMAAGSDAAKSAANIVLMNNHFSAMPSIVDEGRRVINNISMSGSLLLVQVMFSIFITLFTILLGGNYPFVPLQLTITNAFFVGFPSFFLNLESNLGKVEGDFLRDLLKRAFPPALTISVGTTLIVTIGPMFQLSPTSLSVLCLLFTAWNYMLVQKRIYAPISPYRKMVFLLTQSAYFLSLVIGQEIFGLGQVSYGQLLILVALLNFSPLFHDISFAFFGFLERKYKVHFAQKYKKTTVEH